jgi:hypothetical protein
MKSPLQKLLLVGILAEIIIFLISYYIDASLENTFRYAARYSGRLSAVTFIAVFYLFASSFPSPVLKNKPLRNGLLLFAVLHLIHFGFLATNVYLNEIPLIPVKLAGGALAYLMIVAAPFFLHKLKPKFQFIYFYYVSFVMIMTYVARVKGDFQGAQPYWLHYAMIAIFVICCVLFGMWMVKKSRKESIN